MKGFIGVAMQSVLLAGLINPVAYAQPNDFKEADPSLNRCITVHWNEQGDHAELSLQNDCGRTFHVNWEWCHMGACRDQNGIDVMPGIQRVGSGAAGEEAKRTFHLTKMCEVAKNNPRPACYGYDWDRGRTAAPFAELALSQHPDDEADMNQNAGNRDAMNAVPADDNTDGPLAPDGYLDESAAPALESIRQRTMPPTPKRVNIAAQTECIGTESFVNDKNQQWVAIKNECAVPVRVGWCHGERCSNHRSATILEIGQSHETRIDEGAAINILYACQLKSGMSAVMADYETGQCFTSQRTRHP